MAVRHHLAAVAPAHAPDGESTVPEAPRPDTLVQSYRQLADVFHDILSEHSLDNLLERIADTLAELVPHDTLSIYQADEAQTLLTPVLARDKWAEQDHEQPLRLRRGHHRLGRSPPRAGPHQPGAPRPAHEDRARDAARRGRGADHGSADRPRRGQGRAQHLPPRRGGELQRRGVRAGDPLRRRRRAGARQRADPRAARVPGADGLADRPLQPPLLPRAPAGRAHPREPHAGVRRRADARHRRLQARQRRLRPRLGRPGADRPGRPPARGAARLGRRLPARRRGVRRDHGRRGRGRRVQPGEPPDRHARRRRVRAGGQDHDLGRRLAGPRARDEPARAGGVRRGRDDDRQGARQEPDRALRRAVDRAARTPSPRAAATCARSPT